MIWKFWTTINIFISNYIASVEILIAEYSEDLNLIIDAINDGKHGIVHPQILTPDVLVRELRQIEEIVNQKYPIKLTTANYQHTIDVSETAIGIIHQKIVNILKIPILKYENFLTYHLIPIRIHHEKTLLAPISSHEIVLTIAEKSLYYIPFDTTSLQQCKNINDLRICSMVVNRKH